MTSTPNAPRIHVDLTLHELTNGRAIFGAYLRAEPANAAAEGFEVEGPVYVRRSISQESWEGLGSPVVLPITLHSLATGQ